MLIKTQVKRRTESINNYILGLKQKICTRRFRQAKNLLKTSRQALNSSFMTPYDPNSYLLDTLKSKRDKLIKQRTQVQNKIKRKLQDINTIKLRRGYIKKQPIATNTAQQQNNNSLYSHQFVQKLRASEGISYYVSRIPIKLDDSNKLDYEQNIVINTDFHTMRICYQEQQQKENQHNISQQQQQNQYVIIQLPYGKIISCETDSLHLLICWRPDKSQSSYHMVIRFDSQEERKIWFRCINFCKLICQSQFKDQLLYKQPQTYAIKQSNKNRQQLQSINQKQQSQKPSNANYYNSHNNYINKNLLNMNLNINSNKSQAFDRLRRKSQYYPQNGQNQLGNFGLNNRYKSRKVSQDLSMKQSAFNKSNYYEKKLNTQKSQKSLSEEQSPANLVDKQRKQQRQQARKIQINTSNNNNNKVQKLLQQRQRLFSQAKMSSQNTQSHRQIFFNQSSIHWIQQQNQQVVSKSSNSVNKNMFVKKNLLEVLNKDNHVQPSQHISEVPADGQQSPMLPYNMRQKIKKNGEKGKFQVRVRQVQNSNAEKLSVQQFQYEQRNSHSQSSQKNAIKPPLQSRGRTNSRHSKNNASQNSKQHSSSKQQEQYTSQKQNQIQSINEQSEDEDSQQKQKNDKVNLNIQDKSEDIVSENENSQTQSKKYGLDDLKHGILLLKCSPNGWNPHLKKLHLSNNDSQLCWKNQKGDDLKKINLSSIERIDYNTSTITGGILKHIKKNIEKKRCLVIKYKESNDYKMLEFYLPQDQKTETLEEFYQKLTNFIRFKTSQQL